MALEMKEMHVTADKFDNLLVQSYGCVPAPETQLTFFKEE